MRNHSLNVISGDLAHAIETINEAIVTFFIITTSFLLFLSQIKTIKEDAIWTHVLNAYNLFLSLRIQAAGCVFESLK